MIRCAFVEPVGQRRRGRLVDDPQDFESRDAPGVARGGALGVVEVGRHGDDGTVHFRVHFALRGEELLGPALQLAENEGGDFRRREFPVAEPDPDDARGIAGAANGNNRASSPTSSAPCP